MATPEEAPQETTEDPDAAAAQDTAAEDSAAEDIQQAEDAQPAEDTQDEVIDIGGEPEAFCCGNGAGREPDSSRYHRYI